MEYLTPKMVSEMLHIGIKKAYKLFRLKGFPGVKIDRQWLVEKSDLEKFIREYSGSALQLG